MISGLPIWLWIGCLFLPIMIIGFWIVRRKHVFPYVYVILFGLEYLNPDFLGQIFTIAKLAPMVLFSAYLLNLKGKFGLRSNRIFTPALILSLYFIVSLLWTIDLSNGMVRGVSFILLLISFWLVAHITQDEDVLWHFLGAFVLLSMVISFASISIFIAKIGELTLVRTGAFRLNANGSALLINLGTFPIIIMLLNQLKGWKWLPAKWYPFVIVMNLLGLLSTASRTGILIFILCILLLFMIHSRLLHRHRWKMIVGGITILFLIFFINTRYSFISNFFSRFDTITINDSNDYFSRFAPTRAMIWGEAWEIFLKHPVLGVGLMSFLEVSSIKAAPHNSFIWALVEGGIIGGIIWTILFSTVLLGTARSLRVGRYIKDIRFEGETLSLLAMLVALLIYSFSVDIVFNKFFWIVLAMTESIWGIRKLKLMVVKNLNKIV